jgi:hypothetical protein
MQCWKRQGFAKPDEVAELICYLLTFEGHYLLGQIIFNVAAPTP